MKDIEANTIRQKNEREKEIAESNKNLQIARYQFEQEKETKRIETDNAPKQREQELKVELEQKTALAKLEEIRATQLAQTKVDAEKAIAFAEGDAKAKERVADAVLYQATKQAEAILAKTTAEAEGLQKFLDIDNTEMVKFFLAVDRNVFVDMAQKTADAINGLQPKINIWNTGSTSEQNPYAALKDIFTSLPPMLDAVQTQTNIKLPNWLPQNK
jgi:flotillin